ncbi:hypothetical protein UlMin_037044 [Ulmus minor]
MENFLRSKEYWHVVSEGITEPIDSMTMTQAQRTELEGQRLKDLKSGESVTYYFSRTMAIVNKMRIQGDKTKDMTIVEKILRSMTPKFNFVVCYREEFYDIDELSIDELQSSLSVHEHKFN